MTEFARVRSELEAAREKRRNAEATLAAAERTVARLRATRAEAARGARDLISIDRQLDQARAAATDSRARVSELSAVAARRGRDFEAIADPRTQITQWEDDIPILLFPVRLETRFKSSAGSTGASDELWVRIVPDRCSIDTFEPALSKTEDDSGRRFWIETWAAGGIELQRRAAWRNLVASHGSGRAAWIVRHVAPADSAPVKANAEDIVLVIVTDAPPGAAGRSAVSDYWIAMWRADGRRQQTEAAHAGLVATGISDAEWLVTQFKPANLSASPIAPAKRADVDVQVAWLRLPAAADLKTSSWTAPAHVDVLPDRFLVIGYQNENVVCEALGGLVSSPLVAGPNPSATPEEQLRHDAAGDLHVPEDMRWMVDFDAAVSVGMGIKVPLDPARVDPTRPLQRLVAVGVRLADSVEQSTARLEELLTHHRYGPNGLAFVPHGTPTNNTDQGAGYSRFDDGDASYDVMFGDSGALVATNDWWQRCDGQWLADAIGVDPQLFDRTLHASRIDGAEARAMNRALWPATFGYALETMLQPVFSAAQVDATRWFYTHFVSGRGMLPSLRIGNQPYGVLPTSAVSTWKWLSKDRLASVAGLDMPPGFLEYRQGLAALLARVRTDWSALAKEVSFVGMAGDPHQVLLDVVGLHPSSVEFHQRYAESVDHIFNRAKLHDLAAQIVEAIRAQGLQTEARQLLQSLGYNGPVEPTALSRFFFTKAHRLNGPLIDDRPLSERDPVRPYTDDQRNYLTWMVDAARTSFEDLRQERGFSGDRAPDTLLYLMLRHALLLGYWDSSVRLHVAANLMSAEAFTEARREPTFLHVAENSPASESRFVPLYSEDHRVTGGANVTVAEHIRSVLGGTHTQALADQIAALDLLKTTPTARLERCLAEHLDTASFRLDAWLLGLVHYQLAAMRYRTVSGRGHAQRGVHLGAYGWLENLQRKAEPLKPAFADKERIDAFGRRGEPAVMRDPGNAGYVMAPSLNHATTAAILRAGYLANASAADPAALAVNLSSGRVRVALGLIEGIRNGQPLGALLGYRLQRGLHDRHPSLELDRFVHPLRKRFPLVADQLTSTRTEEGVPIEAIEANNVIDGLKLIEHLQKTGADTYPFGLSLPSANAEESAAITAEVSALLDAHDALADLALAESVHQAVLGNYDRVGATLDAYAKGTFPPEPDVVRTPRSGLALTHRVGVHLDAAADGATSSLIGIPMSPRARAQPMINQWLRDVLPSPDDVGCLVEWFEPVANAPRSRTITQRMLRLQPIDLLHLVSLDGDAAIGELDDRILAFIHDTHAPRADAAITIRHTARQASPIKSFFEIAPLIRHLRSIVLRSRPLTPTDLTLPSEARDSQNGTQSIAPTRVQNVWDELDALRQDLGTVTIAAPVDAAMASVVRLFERAAKFGIQQVGWGVMYEWRRRTFADVAARVQEVIDRWEDRLAQFDAGLSEYDGLPAGTTDEERFAALGRLNLLVASMPISPRPALNAYRSELDVRRASIAAKRADMQTLLATNNPRLAPFIAAVQAAAPWTEFDQTRFSLDDVGREVDLFIADLKSRVEALIGEVGKRLSAALQHVQAHNAAVGAEAKVLALQKAGQALFGEGMKLVPEFRFGAEQAADFAQAHDASRTGVLTRYLREHAHSTLPVDDWLHGVARVREKLHAWEQAAALAATFGRIEPDLVPIQLPYHDGEGWLAMDYEASAGPDGERLLYTAHHAVPFDPAGPVCGLLIDEWTEVVPGRSETAGLTFHYDRPSSEPPQTWLLVTPSAMNGHWQWNDVVDALSETLALARLRLVEPAQVDRQAYARFLPATTSAVTLYGISIAANYSRVNNVVAQITGELDG